MEQEACMAERFAGRAAIVTGGVSGIGAGIAARLGGRGRPRQPVGHRRRRARQRRSPAHGHARRHRPGRRAARRRRHRRRHSARSTSWSPRAGITGPNATTWEYPVAAWDRVIDVNLKGVFYCNRAVVPFMQTQRLRPHRQHRLDRRQGRQSQRLCLLRVEGRRDRADQVAGQGTRRHRTSGSTASPRPR